MQRITIDPSLLVESGEGADFPKRHTERRKNARGRKCQKAFTALKNSCSSIYPMPHQKTGQVMLLMGLSALLPE